MEVACFVFILFQLAKIFTGGLLGIKRKSGSVLFPTLSTSFCRQVWFAITGAVRYFRVLGKALRKPTWHLSSLIPILRTGNLEARNIIFVLYSYTKSPVLWLWCLCWHFKGKDNRLACCCYQRLTAEAEINILLVTVSDDTDFNGGRWKCPFYPENLSDNFTLVLFPL